MYREDIPLPQTSYTFDEEGGVVEVDASEFDWERAQYLVINFITHEDWVVALHLHFYDRHGGHLEARMGAIPGLEVTMAFPLSALNFQSFKLPRTPGKLKTVISGSRVDKAQVTKVAFGTAPSFKPQSFQITGMYLSDEEPDYKLKDRPIVDELGQWAEKEWPGKTKGVAELTAYLKSAVDEASGCHKFGSDRSVYGGWLAKRFAPSGFFRTEHDGERWWLVDPDGYAFWSAGLDCIRPGPEGRVDGIEKLHYWLPPKEGEFADAWNVRSDGTYFNYGIANLIRAFGGDWWDGWFKLTRRRLLCWGFNTVGNWSEKEFVKKARVPYVWPLAGFPSTKLRIFRDFPDVYSDEFRRNAVRFAAQLEEFRGDPYMIGYFLTNEPKWAFAGQVDLASELISSKEDLQSKGALMEFLQGKYSGDVAALNEAWGTALNSFSDLASPLDPAALSETARSDLSEFSHQLVYEYTKVVCDAVRRVDPDHLNLGMRYAFISSERIFAGCDLFDVFTINMYQMRPNREQIETIARRSGLPVMIGEYHFGALDVGLMSTGLRAVTSQAERGVAYRYYLEGGAALPDLIGVHYFHLNDQALLGRDDGENYQIGLIDVCQRPYDDFVAGVVEGHRAMYDVAAAVQSPFSRQPEEIPRVGF